MFRGDGAGHRGGGQHGAGQGGLLVRDNPGPLGEAVQVLRLPPSSPLLLLLFVFTVVEVLVASNILVALRLWNRRRDGGREIGREGGREGGRERKML